MEAARVGFGIKGCVGSSGYTYKTVARKVIAYGSEPVQQEEVWDNLEMNLLMEWLPDESQHLLPLKTLSCRAARSQFGMSPLWISCFSCYTEKLDTHERKALMNAQSIQIFNAIEKYKATHGVFPSVQNMVRAIV